MTDAELRAWAEPRPFDELCYVGPSLTLAAVKAAVRARLAVLAPDPQAREDLALLAKVMRDEMPPGAKDNERALAALALLDHFVGRTN